MSIFDRLKISLKYRLGILRLEDEMASLHYLMNNCIDITKLPTTCNPKLRMLQKCDLLLLAIFDKMCTQEGLSYWLDYGTLLGAVRHGGFIPWDDDIDVNMTRKDYDVICDTVKKRLSKYDIEITPCDIHELRCYQVKYKYDKAGVCFDIFSSDQFRYDGDLNDSKNDIAMKMYAYRRFFLGNLKQDSAFMNEKKSELFGSMMRGGCEFFAYPLEGYFVEDKVVIEDTSCFFPLKRVKFDDFFFPIPANAERVLRDEYGPNYMQFPKIAMNNHGVNPNDLPPVLRADANGVNMEKVYSELLTIYNSL